MWLARSGWKITTVDISETALNYARQNADKAGVAGNIDFQRHDLSESFPEDRYDLITALFLQTPLAFPRIDILRQAASAVVPGGLLLVVSHGSRASWSWSVPETVYPTAMENLEKLNLDRTGRSGVLASKVTTGYRKIRNLPQVPLVRCYGTLFLRLVLSSRCPHRQNPSWQTPP